MEHGILILDGNWNFQCHLLRRVWMPKRKENLTRRGDPLISVDTTMTRSQARRCELWRPLWSILSLSVWQYKYDASTVQDLHTHMNTKGQRMWNSGQCISMSSFVKSDNNWVEHFEFSRLWFLDENCDVVSRLGRVLYKFVKLSKMSFRNIQSTFYTLNLTGSEWIYIH